MVGEVGGHWQGMQGSHGGRTSGGRETGQHARPCHPKNGDRTRSVVEKNARQNPQPVSKPVWKREGFFLSETGQRGQSHHERQAAAPQRPARVMGHRPGAAPSRGRHSRLPAC